MRQLIAQMQRVAPHLTMATLEGEEGTGRSLAARALHAAGPAASGPFVSWPAAHFFASDTRPQGSGAWSDAILNQARGGMLFLDLVHQLSADQQEALTDFLHCFDDQSFASGDPFPAQVVFSTSLSLRHSHFGFREDLASRICAVRFRLPPLNERREDIPLLAQLFIQRFARVYGKPVRGLGPGTITPLLRYAWPRNVRELEETIAAAALATESQWIRPIDLPPMPGGNTHGHSAVAGTPEAKPEPGLDLDSAIRDHVDRVLRRTRGNKLRAAQLLGISRSTLYRILAAQPGHRVSAEDPIAS